MFNCSVTYLVGAIREGDWLVKMHSNFNTESSIDDKFIYYNNSEIATNN